VLGCNYHREGAGIQLSYGECWDAIIIGRVLIYNIIGRILRYNYHNEGAEIQLS
jgi:hypothetical protein